MKRVTWLATGVLFVTLTWAALAQAETAHAEMHDAKGKKVGEVTLKETPHGLLITATFDGIPPGEHAFHVHAVGKCEPPFKSAGGHFNPTHKQHGIENPAGMHAGDLPNIYVPENGKLKVDVFGPGLRLKQGEGAILDADGAALVLHAGRDDYASDPAGNAGDRIACGVVVP